MKSSKSSGFRCAVFNFPSLQPGAEIEWLTARGAGKKLWGGITVGWAPN